MSKRIKLSAVVVVAACLTGFMSFRSPAAVSGGNERFFEMRTYYAAEGKADALDARFRNHTNKLFQKHGMELVGYWHRADKPDVLVYILAYPSKEAREKSWKEFNADPEWQAAKKKSEEQGTLVAKAESVFMTPTDYSPIK